MLTMKSNKIIKVFLFSVIFFASITFLTEKASAYTSWSDGGTTIVYVGNKLNQIKTDPLPVGVSCTTTFNQQTQRNETSCSTSVEAGYKITSYIEGNNNTVPAIPPEIQFMEDEQTYPQYYNISPSGSGNAYPPTCGGGLSTRISCVPSDGYIKDTCPHDISIADSEPHYCQGGKTFNVSFVKESVPDVDIVGADIKAGGTEYGKGVKGGEMTVSAAQSNTDKNVQIYWYTENVSSSTGCLCNEGDCGSGISSRPNEAVFANGDASGNYALTETTTFKVTCP